MKSMLILVLAAGLAFFPYGAAVEAQNTSSEHPPIAQPLVSEGQFAVELANALGLTSSQHQAAAEDALARVNIAPRNGWISDYPMTPDIIEEVRQSAARSASEGVLKMSQADAARTVADVSAGLNLPVRESGNYSQPGDEYGPPGQYVEPSDIDSYYGDYGPPIVTYYTPPWAYAYLYDWVPYPFWWNGFYFGGYYILGDFDSGGGYYHHYYHGGHGNRWAGHRITNHVSGANGAVTRINPATRATGGTNFSTRPRFNAPGARAILGRSGVRQPGAAAGNLGGTSRSYPGGAHSGALGFRGTQSRPAYQTGGTFGGSWSSHSFSRGGFSGGMGGGFGGGGFRGGFGGFGGHGGGFGGHGGGGGHR